MLSRLSAAETSASEATTAAAFRDRYRYGWSKMSRRSIACAPSLTAYGSDVGASAYTFNPYVCRAAKPNAARRHDHQQRRRHIPRKHMSDAGVTHAALQQERSEFWSGERRQIIATARQAIFVTARLPEQQHRRGGRQETVIRVLCAQAGTKARCLHAAQVCPHTASRNQAFMINQIVTPGALPRPSSRPQRPRVARQRRQKTNALPVWCVPSPTPLKCSTRPQCCRRMALYVSSENRRYAHNASRSASAKR